MKNPTRHKLREAEYFLSMMRQSFEDDNKFIFNLSAFLSASRSITWHMQKQYRHVNGFNEWYGKQETRMSQDMELKYLNDARVEDVHKKPVRVGASREAAVSLDVILGSPLAEQAKGAKPEPQAQINVKTVRRFFPKFKNVDVIEFCDKQLAKLTKLVEECDQQLP